mmetsp:Transcript_88018/g.152492  ORF Transcript_88018/g.152492 Transcript_88018/m.152492 type:complete len:202 (+) Transcript_88018:689-1294(+)
MPRWPSPPTPTTPTAIPGLQYLFRGENVVMPAQSRGAAYSEGSESGTGKVHSAGYRMYCAKPPLSLPGPAYVLVIFGQMCSSLALQLAHLPQFPRCTPMPTRAPTLNLSTPGPSLTTSPTISWPGTSGKHATPQAFFSWCKSEPQIPQWLIITSTCPSGGSIEIGYDQGANGSPAEWQAIHCTSIVAMVKNQISDPPLRGN